MARSQTQICLTLKLLYWMFSRAWHWSVSFWKRKTESEREEERGKRGARIISLMAENPRPFYCKQREGGVQGEVWWHGALWWESCHCLFFANIFHFIFKDHYCTADRYKSPLCAPLLVIPLPRLWTMKQKSWGDQTIYLFLEEHNCTNANFPLWLDLFWLGKASCFHATGNKEDPTSPASHPVKNSFIWRHYPNHC